MSRVRTRKSINESLAYTSYKTKAGVLITTDQLQADYIAARRLDSTEDLMSSWTQHYNNHVHARLLGGDETPRNIVELLEDIATILVLERGVDDPRLTEFVIHEDTTA